MLSSEEENPSVHKTYVNFPTSRKSALDAPLYAISSGRSERPKNGADAQPCLSDVYKMSTRAKRRQADVPLCGRSMVEMLGVLAIIGVLSVGAIAGYSKAMLKYKLNKQAESFNMLLNNAIQLRPELKRAATDNGFQTDLFDKLNLIPDGMKYMGNKIIHDVFNNTITINYSYYPTTGFTYYMYLSVNRSGNKSSNEFREICRTIVTVAKENSANLLSIQMRSAQDENDPENYTTARLMGDNFCINNHPDQCLRYAGLTEMDALCNSCDSEVSCSFYVVIGIDL